MAKLQESLRAIHSRNARRRATPRAAGRVEADWNQLRRQQPATEPDHLETALKTYTAAKQAWEGHTKKAITTADGQLLSGIVLGLLARHKENALSTLNADDPELDQKLERLWATWGIQKLTPTRVAAPTARQKKMIAVALDAVAASGRRQTPAQPVRPPGIPRSQRPAITDSHRTAMRFRVNVARQQAAKKKAA